jgi:Ulp1 family protease
LICFLFDDPIGNFSIQDFHGAKQNNGSDCGVYIIKYIQEIVEDFFNNTTLSGVYSDSDINDFRNE